jgi:predicted Zn-dependent peptidase
VAGISHFLEHTVFKGTSSRNTYEIANALESVGGHVNAFTTKEYTAYHARFLADYLETAVDLLCDLLLNPIFPKDEVEREKGVVLDELRDSADVPEEVVFEKFDADLFPESSLGTPIIGNPETIRSFTPELLNDYLHKHYGPENTIIVAAGYLEHDDLVAMVEQRYGEVSPGNGTEATLAPKPQITGEQVYLQDIQQCHLVTGIRAFSVYEELRWDLAVMNAILSSGMSSRLFQNIREQHGVAYAVFSFASLYRDSGSFGVYLATDPERRELAVELTRKELQRLVDEPVSSAELERVKAQYKSGVVMSEESMERRMLRLGRQQIYHGKNLDLDVFLAKIEAIDADKIQALARELFKDNQFLTTILQPRNGQDFS